MERNTRSRRARFLGWMTPKALRSTPHFSTSPDTEREGANSKHPAFASSSSGRGLGDAITALFTKSRREPTVVLGVAPVMNKSDTHLVVHEEAVISSAETTGSLAQLAPISVATELIESQAELDETISNEATNELHASESQLRHNQDMESLDEVAQSRMESHEALSEEATDEATNLGSFMSEFPDLVIYEEAVVSAAETTGPLAQLAPISVATEIIESQAELDETISNEATNELHASESHLRHNQDMESLDEVAQGWIGLRAALSEEATSEVDNLGSFVSKFLETLWIFNRMADNIPAIHPFVQSACTVLASISEVITEQAEWDEIVQGLLEKMTEVYTLLNGEQPERIVSAQAIVRLICHQTLECSYFIKVYAQNRRFRRWVSKWPKASIPDHHVKQYLQVFEQLQWHFQDGASVPDSLLIVHTIWDDLDYVDDFGKAHRHLSGTEILANRRLAQAAMLHSMAYLPGTALDSSKICLEGTRKEVLDEIMEWASNTEHDTPRIFWLHGTAGKGKSAIAQTIALYFKAIQRLGSCFCFDRSYLFQERHRTIFSTIARDLAELDKNLRKKLVDAIHKDPTLRHSNDLLHQWTELILKPLQSLSDTMAGPIVIVIDALDESGIPPSREILLRILSGRLGDDESQIYHLPPNLRFLITSTPLPDINRALGGVRHVRGKSIDSIPQSSTEADIRLYVEYKLSEETELAEEDLKSLTVASDGSFEWARLACAYITSGWTGPTGGHPVKERLERVVSRSKAASDNLLDGMYQFSLREILPEYHYEVELFLAIFRSVMAQIIGTARPMSTDSLQAMREYFPGDQRHIRVNSVVYHMAALLSGTTGSSVVRPLHASFIDFLTSEDRSGTFFVDLSRIDDELAFACLGIMEGKLRFNICQFPSSYLANFEIPDLTERIDQNISPELSYSCCFWTDHLNRAAFTELLAGVVRSFFGHERLLFWLEVLSLLKRVNTCYWSLSCVIDWIRLLPGDSDDWAKLKTSFKDIADDATDAQRFIRLFGGPISYSTPHLYVSALPFSPRDCRISQKFAKHFPGILRVAQGQDAGWSVAQGVIHGHTDSVTSVLFSPDGSRILSASADKTIRLWDAETGEPIQPRFEGPHGGIQSVAFSPDGKKFASGSSDKTIRIWESGTGKVLLQTLKGHGHRVSSVAFSPDGTQIISGSDDATVALWSANTGEQLFRLLGHCQGVTSVAFSPNGGHIASASLDKTICLYKWDREEGKPVDDAIIIKGHLDGILSVAFSADGSRMVSGSSDNTIRLWNVEDPAKGGQSLIGHKDIIYAVAFSPDGTKIVSSSKDTTVRLWSVQTGEQLGLPLEGHDRGVLSVAFSPDGKRVVSGSWDTKIRVWNAGDVVEELRSPRRGHDEAILSVAFCPNSRRVASGSHDKTIRLWNADTGELVGSAWKGHEDTVTSLAFSPDGTKLVSGSNDKTVRLWKVLKGEQFIPPLEGHTGYVTSVVFSPTGELIASASSDKTIRLWNADTGTQLRPFLQGHDGLIMSIAFSPDGHHIVSGSEDNTMLLWDVHGGKGTGSPFKGSEGCVNSVTFSPDGSKIASGSSDQNIRIWSREPRELLSQSLTECEGWLESVVFSSDARHIISRSSDRTIRVWDVQSLELIQVLRVKGHILTFSPDSRRMELASYNKAIRIWEVDTSAIYPDEHRICFSTSRHHSLRVYPDHSAFYNPALAPWMTANFVEVDDRGWTRFQKNAESCILFWVPPSYHPLWFPDSVVKVVPGPEVELDLSNMVHGTMWHSCYVPSRS